MSENILSILSKNYQIFTKSERKVTDYIIENPIETQYMSITSLASICEVADSTVTRFCRKLDLTGYNELKIELVKASGDTMFQSNTNMDESNESTPNQKTSNPILNSTIQALYDTHARVNPDDITTVGKLFHNANSVYCFGQGGSSVVAKGAWSTFVSIAPQFHYIEDSHMQIITSSLCKMNDVILYFSYSGATREITDTLRVARGRGAKIVLLTHYEESPASKYADIILLCGTKEGPLFSGSVPAKITQLYIIDLLLHEFSEQNIQFTNNNRLLTADALSNKLL